MLRRPGKCRGDTAGLRLRGGLLGEAVNLHASRVAGAALHLRGGLLAGWPANLRGGLLRKGCLLYRHQASNMLCCGTAGGPLGR